MRFINDQLAANVKLENRRGIIIRDITVHLAIRDATERISADRVLERVLFGLVLFRLIFKTGPLIPSELTCARVIGRFLERPRNS